MKLILLGYMASGKSFIGKELSIILDFDFIDLDTYIESREGMSINAIFEHKGEIYFRNIEHIYLKELLANDDRNVVIALGGGTPCYANNLNEIQNSSATKTVYLRVSIQNLVARLLKEKNTRPLIAHLTSQDELVEYVGKHLFERSHYYNQAEYIVDANVSKEDIIETILFELF